MEMKDLKEGMKFVVASDKNGKYWDRCGYMNKYLGAIMTVNVHGVDRLNDGTPFLYAVEDNRRFSWFPWMIDWDATAKLNEVKPVDLLETGMVIEFENGERALVLVGDMPTEMYGKQKVMFLGRGRGFMTGGSYSDDLITESGLYNINKIYKPYISSFNLTFDGCNDLNLIWQRPEPKPEVKTIKMTSAELLSKLGLDGNTKIEIEG